MPHQQHGDRHQQDADDCDVRIAATAMHGRPHIAGGGGVALDPVVADFVNHARPSAIGNPSTAATISDGHDPFRETQRIECHVGDLQDEPDDDGITGGDSDDATFAQAEQKTGLHRQR